MSTKRTLDPIVGILTGMAGRIFVPNSRGRTERLIARFSTRQLEDMGFERDWDGSVYRSADQR